jgi:hypothetical protein
MLALARELKDANSLMFFARGNNYATALEAALKVCAAACACVLAACWRCVGAGVALCPAPALPCTRHLKDACP